jgi:hypothetical protein
LLIEQAVFGFFSFMIEKAACSFADDDFQTARIEYVLMG